MFVSVDGYTCLDVYSGHTCLQRDLPREEERERQADGSRSSPSLLFFRLFLCSTGPRHADGEKCLNLSSILFLVSSPSVFLDLLPISVLLRDG